MQLEATRQINTCSSKLHAAGNRMVAFLFCFVFLFVCCCCCCCCWFFFVFLFVCFFAFPSYISGVHHFGVRFFAYVTVF